MFSSSLPWIVFTIVTIVEALLLTIRTSKKVRFFVGCGVIVLLAAAHSAITVNASALFGVPFMAIGLYRLINIIRFMYGRMHEDYLYRATHRTGRTLLIVQAAVGVLTYGASKTHGWSHAVLVVVGVMQLLVAAAVIVSLRVNIRRSALLPVESLPDSQLPSLSVLIPARNETEDLDECLRTITASTYKKLEVLVLDDCSQDRTPQIIKDFAHQGVRFVEGSEPGENWLPKNAAYEKLAHEASGDYLLFCGVDVRIEPDTLRKLISYMQVHKLSMLSLLPSREPAVKSGSIPQQIRYMWELALPRFLSHRPPVLSTLWVIEASVFKKYGGMAAVRRQVVPEVYFAAKLDRANLYAFLRANDDVQVRSVKSFAEQKATALRVRYPQLHRRPEVVLGVAAFELGAIIGAPLLAVYGVTQHYLTAAVLGSVASLLLIVACGLLSQLMNHHFHWKYFVRSLVLMPYDLWLMHHSMYVYELDEVRWKDRNVCLPVMHSIPTLPKLP